MLLGGRGVRYLTSALSFTCNGYDAAVTFLKGRREMLINNRYGPRGAGATLGAAVVVGWVAVMLFGPQPAFAAPRTVLCEEFTNIW